MTDICVGNLVVIGSDNGMSPGRRQAIISANTGMLIAPSWTHFSEILIGVRENAFETVVCTMAAIRFDLNVLINGCSDIRMLCDTIHIHSRVNKIVTDILASMLL